MFKSLSLIVAPVLLGAAAFSEIAPAQTVPCESTLACAQAALSAAKQAQDISQKTFEFVHTFPRHYISNPIHLQDCGKMAHPLEGRTVNINKCPLRFPATFPNAQVQVALSGFNIVNEDHRDQAVLRVSASDVDNNGFNVEIESNIDERLADVFVIYFVTYSH